jgi:hypothetical protein
MAIIIYWRRDADFLEVEIWEIVIFFLQTTRPYSTNRMSPAYNFNSAQVVGNVKTQALSKLS